MSKYVQRCSRCREVRGVSSFRVERTGGRVTVCHWCEARAGNIARELGGKKHSLNSLRRREGELRAKLAEIRAEIRLVETELSFLAEDKLRLRAIA